MLTPTRREDLRDVIRRTADSQRTLLSIDADKDPDERGTCGSHVANVEHKVITAGAFSAFAKLHNKIS